MQAPEVHGKRVKIRPPEPKDMGEFTRLARSSHRFLARWSSPPADSIQYSEYLARNRKEDFAAFLLCARSDDRILGAAGLSQIFHRNFQSAYLGYWIGAPFARKGYMQEGLDLVLHTAFRTLHLHRVEANVQPENTSSRALLIRLGFRLEGYSPRYLKIGGRWRDHERWAILREEWTAGRQKIERGRLLKARK